jgi:DNA polymerase-3 subunit delta
VEFAIRTAAEIENWVITIAGHNGKRFTHDAIKRFLESAGETMTEIRVELNKLLAYTEEKKGITADDVISVCHIPLKVRIFDLLDNVIAGNKRQALIDLGSLLQEREPPMRILSMLSNHLIILRQMKLLAEGGVKLNEATGLMGLNRYRAEKIWRQCTRVTAGAAAAAIYICYKTDSDIKSGIINDVPALYNLVASITMQAV